MMKLKEYNRVELRALKDAYFAAKALYEAIRNTAEKIKKDILEKYPFYEETNTISARILNPFDTYLMSDEDFNKYLDLCYTEYRAAGIADKRGKEYCPDAESRGLLLQAEKMLVEFAIDIMPGNMTKEKESLRRAAKSVKYKDKIINLILRLED